MIRLLTEDENKELKEIDPENITVIPNDENESEINDEENAPEVAEEDSENSISAETNQELLRNSFQDALKDLSTRFWDIISNIHSLVATFEFDFKEESKNDILEVLNGIIDDATIDIGMVQKALELVNAEGAMLINDGVQKAEEIINKESEKSTEEDDDSEDKEDKDKKEESLKESKNTKYTWNDLYNIILKNTSRRAFANNIIGELMDKEESWDWNAEVPFDVEKFLTAQHIAF